MAKVKKTITTGHPEARNVGTPEEEAIISDIRTVTFDELEKGYKPGAKVGTGKGKEYQFQTQPEHYTKYYKQPRSKERFESLGKEVKSLTPEEQQRLKQEIDKGEDTKYSKRWGYENLKHDPREGSRIYNTIQEIKKRGSQGMTVEEFQGGSTGKEHLAERSKVVKARGFGCPYRNLRPYMKGSRAGILELRDGKVFYKGGK